MKLLDQCRQIARVRHLALRTERSYLYWIERYIRFHNIQHPATLGAAEVESFLTDLAVSGNVSASTQNQALAALLFLYRDVLKRDIGQLDAVRARRPHRVPVVLSQGEVAALLVAIDELPSTEPYGLIVRLLYGAGLRLLECCRLRMKDVDFARGQLTIREGKGNKDRFVMLPSSTYTSLERQMQWRRALHERDLVRGYGRVEMPSALARKFPGADHSLAWQFIFASTKLSHDPRSGEVGRHHLHESAVARSMTSCVRKLGWTKRVTCHTLRHSFATHLLELGQDIRTVQEFFFFNDTATTEIYTHVMNKVAQRVRSPLDLVAQK